MGKSEFVASTITHTHRHSTHTRVHPSPSWTGVVQQMATGNNLKRPPNINPSYEFLLSLSWSLSFSSGFYLVYTWALLLLLFLLLAACCLWLFFHFLKWWVGYLSVPTASRTTATTTTATTTRHNKLFATHDFSCNFEFKILHTLFSLCCFSSTRLTLPTPLTIRLPLLPPFRPSLGCCPLAWPAIEAERQQNKMLLLWPSWSACCNGRVCVRVSVCASVCERWCVCLLACVCVCRGCH